MGTTVHDLWDFIGFVGGKTCFIDHNSVSYFCAHCAIVCFDSELDLVGAITVTSVIKGSVKNIVTLGSRKTSFSAQDQFKLTRIYTKKSASISRLLAFGGKTWVLIVGASPVHAFHDASMSLGFNKIGKPLPPIVDNLESCLVGIKSSLVSFVEQIRENIVIGVDSDEATSDKIVLIVDSTVSLHVVKLEKMLDGLSRSVLSLSAHFDSLALADGMNVLTKQDDIVRWHKDMDNLVSIFTETKLKNKAHLWLVDKFNNVCVFSSGLNSGYVGANVAIVMNRSLARHVYKVSEVLGSLFCIRLLFKNKLSVSILGLYAADEINSLIARAVNESSFVILSGDFNKDGFRKCANFKRCHNLGLVNSLGGSFFAKVPTWSNFQGVLKTIDYVFVSSNLVNAVMQHGVFVVNEHFDTDHRAVSVSLGLGGFLDTRLNFFHKQANKD
ncbi:hypothetical protein G9A89_019307 [Geosiphon pyriformis]|nr:hypothetical protein G9A89_019307 [Geosiphon pyriformis]